MISTTASWWYAKPAAWIEKEQVARLALFLGGGWWIRTTEVSDNRFTVCPLWPLGKSPILELVNGVEPSTCWLQISCSAIEPHQHIKLIDYRLSRRLWYYTTTKSVCQHLFEKNFYFFFTFVKNTKKVLYINGNFWFFCCANGFCRLCSHYSKKVLKRHECGKGKTFLSFPFLPLFNP